MGGVMAKWGGALVERAGSWAGKEAGLICEWRGPYRKWTGLGPGLMRKLGGA